MAPFIFVAFGASRPALECGVAIQRTLFGHRRRQGFAPRIAIHASHAQRHDGAYRGKGVHVAAHIAAAPPGTALSAPRTLALRGRRAA